MLSQAYDRRQDSRFSVHLEVGFTIVDEKTSARITAYHPAILVNRSREGCCLIVERLEIEGFNLRKCVESVKLYYLLISLGDRSGNSQPFELKGSVRWIRSMKDEFIIGLELAPTDEEPAVVTSKRVIGHS